jgi:hypothetical protein
MPKRAFLVLGTESSGTRFMTRILTNAGCAGDDDHDQRWDHEPAVGENIVWRRSVPHAEWWPDIMNMIEQLRGLEYSVFAYVIIRDWIATLTSQVVNRKIGDYELCFQRYQRAYPYIFGLLAQFHVPFVVVSYEQLSSRKYVESTLQVFGLVTGDLPPFEDANAKYYDDTFVDVALAEVGVERPTWLAGEAASDCSSEASLLNMAIRPTIHY